MGLIFPSELIVLIKSLIKIEPFNEEIEVPELNKTDSLDDLIVEQEMLSKMMNCIYALLDKHRIIITLFYFNGRDIEIYIVMSKDKFGGQDKNTILHNTIEVGNQLKDNLMKYLKDNGFWSFTKMN